MKSTKLFPRSWRRVQKSGFRNIFDKKSTDLTTFYFGNKHSVRRPSWRLNYQRVCNCGFPFCSHAHCRDVQWQRRLAAEKSFLWVRQLCPWSQQVWKKLVQRNGGGGEAGKPICRHFTGGGSDQLLIWSTWLSFQRIWWRSGSSKHPTRSRPWNPVLQQPEDVLRPLPTFHDVQSTPWDKRSGLGQPGISLYKRWSNWRLQWRSCWAACFLWQPCWSHLHLHHRHPVPKASARRQVLLHPPIWWNSEVARTEVELPANGSLSVTQRHHLRQHWCTKGSREGDAAKSINELCRCCPAWLWCNRCRHCWTAARWVVLLLFWKFFKLFPTRHTSLKGPKGPIGLVGADFLSKKNRSCAAVDFSSSHSWPEQGLLRAAILYMYNLHFLLETFTILSPKFTNWIYQGRCVNSRWTTPHGANIRPSLQCLPGPKPHMLLRSSLTMQLQL